MQRKEESKNDENDLKEPFIYKEIRTGDDTDFWGTFIYGITISEKTIENKPLTRPPLRPVDNIIYKSGVSEIAKYRHRLQGIHEIGNPNESLHPRDIKKWYSKHQSVSYADPTQDYYPPVFGFGKRACLIGIRLHPKDVLLQRISLYDRGSIGRPYQFATREEAEKDYKERLESKKDFNSLDDLAKTNATEYNEVMARLKWNIDGSSHICIFVDTLEARLLAQVRANDLKKRLEAMFVENKKQLPRDYNVPISFYTNWEPEKKERDESNQINTSYYSEEEKKADLEKGKELGKTNDEMKNIARLLELQLNDFKKDTSSISLDDLIQIGNLTLRLGYDTASEFIKTAIYPRLNNIINNITNEKISEDCLCYLKSYIEKSRNYDSAFGQQVEEHIKSYISYFLNQSVPIKAVISHLEEKNNQLKLVDELLSIEGSDNFVQFIKGLSFFGQIDSALLTSQNIDFLTQNGLSNIYQLDPRLMNNENKLLLDALSDDNKTILGHLLFSLYPEKIKVITSEDLNVLLKNGDFYSMRNAVDILLEDKNHDLMNKENWKLLNENPKNSKELAIALSVMVQAKLESKENRQLLIQHNNLYEVASALSILNTGKDLVTQENFEILFKISEPALFARRLVELNKEYPQLIDKESICLLSEMKDGDDKKIDKIITGLNKLSSISIQSGQNLATNENFKLLLMSHDPKNSAEIIVDLFKIDPALSTDKNKKLLLNLRNRWVILYSFSNLVNQDATLKTQEMLEFLINNANDFKLGEAISQLNKLYKKLVNPQNLQVLAANIENAYDIFNALDKLNKEPSLLNDEIFIQLAKQGRYAERIAWGLASLQKCSPELTKLGSQILFDHADRAVFVASGLCHLFKMDKNLITQENCNLVGRFQSHRCSFSTILCELYKANLYSQNNINLILANQKNKEDISNAFIQHSEMQNNLITDVNLNLFIKYSTNISYVFDTLNKLGKLNPNLLNSNSFTILLKLIDKYGNFGVSVIYRRLREIESVLNALDVLSSYHINITNKELSLLASNPILADDIARALVNLNKKNPELVNDQSYQMLAQAKSYYEIGKKVSNLIDAFENAQQERSMGTSNLGIFGGQQQSETKTDKTNAAGQPQNKINPSGG